MAGALRRILLPAVVIVAVVLLLGRMRGASGVAPMPPVFAQGLTLVQAEEQSGKSGKPVLVYATADWCGPCQQFKRTTLVDPGVVAFLSEHTEPVYLNVDKHRQEAGNFNIESIPATIIVRDGKVLAKVAGNVPPADYLEWLKTAVATP